MASFSIQDKILRRNVMAAVFARAADSKDTIISAHGLKHDEALRAMSVLADAIVKGSVKFIRREPILSEQREGSRYEFTAPGVFRMEFPEAWIDAGTYYLKKGKNDVEVVRGLRGLAKQFGCDYAMLVAAYLNLGSETVFHKVFNRDAMGERDQFAGKPVPTQKLDEGFYKHLQGVINRDYNPHDQTPNTHPRAFEAATYLLTKRGSARTNFQVYPVEIGGEAVGVLPALTSRAYESADPDFRDPQRLQAALKYEDRVMAHVLTAYIRWDFRNMRVLDKRQDKASIQ